MRPKPEGSDAATRPRRRDRTDVPVPGRTGRWSDQPISIRPSPSSGASGNPPNVRRLVAVVLTLAVGATLLGFSLTTPPGNNSFYVLTVALGLTWVVGSLASGTLHLGTVKRHDMLRRPVLAPIVLGVLAGGIFVAGGAIVRLIPPLRAYVRTILEHAGPSGTFLVVVAITLGNGVAEELFFRGALFSALGRRAPVIISTLVYALVTATTGNPMLVFAALALGALLGIQRLATRGILAPIITHITWSTIMLLVLPAVVG